MRKFVPEDFAIPLVERAYQLARHAIARSNGHQLEEGSAFWVVTETAWREFSRLEDFMKFVDTTPNRRRLLGLPVRITFQDEEGTPEIQLVMEPEMWVRR